MKLIALTQNAFLSEWLDAASDVIEKLIADGVYQNGQWRLLCRGAVTYQGGKAAYDCLAISMITNNSLHLKTPMVLPKTG